MLRFIIIDLRCGCLRKNIVITLPYVNIGFDEYIGVCVDHNDYFHSAVVLIISNSIGRQPTLLISKLNDS